MKKTVQIIVIIIWIVLMGRMRLESALNWTDLGMMAGLTTILIFPIMILQTMLLNEFIENQAII